MNTIIRIFNHTNPACPVGSANRTGAVKYIMNNTDLSDIVKVTAAMLVKDDKIIIARRGPDDKLADK